MKKLLLLFAMAALAMPRAAAQKTLTAEQTALRTELFDFLKCEGYVPEIDEDGDIAFKAEGNKLLSVLRHHHARGTVHRELRLQPGAACGR